MTRAALRSRPPKLASTSRNSPLRTRMPVFRRTLTWIESNSQPPRKTTSPDWTFVCTCAKRSPTGSRSVIQRQLIGESIADMNGWARDLSDSWLHRVVGNPEAIHMSEKSATRRSVAHARERRTVARQPTARWQVSPDAPCNLLAAYPTPSVAPALGPPLLLS